MKKNTLVLLLVLLVSLTGCGKKDISTIDETHEEIEVEDIESIEPIDAEDYLDDVGSVLTTISVEEANASLSEKNAIILFEERGFVENEIMAEYLMDGSYSGVEARADSEERHPFYETYYESNDGEIWTIDLIGGRIVAYPVIFNQERDADNTVIFAEAETLYSYDSVTNSFYEVAMDEKIMRVVKIPEVSASSLDALTKEVIEGYLNE